jgi:hypothetical protein
MIGDTYGFGGVGGATSSGFGAAAARVIVENIVKELK